MNKHPRGAWTSAALAAPILALVLLASAASPASAADRAVMCEEFTNRYCGSCGFAGPALDRLVSVFPDSFVFVQYQVFDEVYSTPWGDARFAYFHGLDTPTAAFDGADILAGSVADVVQQYTIYRANHFLPDREVPTDVTIHLSAAPVAGQTYRATARVGIEAGGTGKTLRVFILQVLDHWPPTEPYYRNGFKQAAPAQDISLAPGQTQAVEFNFTFDDESWANQQSIKLVAWAQAPLDEAPVTVYQARTRV
jgi:hypothetical protein